MMSQAKNNYKVYKHTSPSGKAYIGITCQDVNKRWKNGKGYDACLAFARAIKKYGWSSIKHEVLYEGLSKDEACKIERMLICIHQTNDPEHGYNITSGGEHYEQGQEALNRLSMSLKAYYKNHPEARRRISESQIGTKHSEEHKRKTSESMKRYIAEHPETRWERGKGKRGTHLSEAERERLRMINQKKVICIETGRIFESVTEASEFLKVGKSALSQHLKEKTKSCGGYHFKYA